MASSSSDVSSRADNSPNNRSMDRSLNSIEFPSSPYLAISQIYRRTSMFPVSSTISPSSAPR